MSSSSTTASSPGAHAGRSHVGPMTTSTAALTVGARCTIAKDIDVRGAVHIGDETVVHPKAVIQAPSDGTGRIVIGAGCIVEELAQITHRGTGTMTIGDRNLFEVGCRVEATSIGHHNTFECKSRTTDAVVIRDFSTVGVACVAQPPPGWQQSGEGEERKLYTFPSRTVIYGEQSSTRVWSGNGVRQADALHAKHLDHLRRNLPEFHTLRMV